MENVFVIRAARGTLLTSRIMWYDGDPCCTANWIFFCRQKEFVKSERFAHRVFTLWFVLEPSLPRIPLSMLGIIWEQNSISCVCG